MRTVISLTNATPEAEATPRELGARAPAGDEARAAARPRKKRTGPARQGQEKAPEKVGEKSTAGGAPRQSGCALAPSLLNADWAGLHLDAASTDLGRFEPVRRVAQAPEAGSAEDSERADEAESARPDLKVKDIAALERVLENARERSLDTFALAQALAEAMCALPAGVVDERLQALAQLVEGAAKKAFEAADTRPPRARPAPAEEYVIPAFF